eukprot:m.297884 g.297884  ORF g.297884 m.297884 type:complete len:822 (-) comp13728_c0_seq1:124-2589(-)
MAETPQRTPGLFQSPPPASSPLSHPTRDRPRRVGVTPPTHKPSPTVQAYMLRETDSFEDEANGHGSPHLLRSPQVSTSELATGSSDGAPRNGSGTGTPMKPLQRFAHAKSEAVRLMSALESCLEDFKIFLTPFTALEDLSAAEQDKTTRRLDFATQSSARVSAIRDAVSRNAMKVVFIGRTSNGKSTTINAMLHAKILPSGIGHTTNCFCQLVGTSEDTPFLTTPHSDERQSIDDVKQLAHALYPEEALGADSILTLAWPQNKCQLLSDDVVILDSPGLDISENFDSWIDQHCTDADVFVLVANAESTLNVTEKNFFFRVTEKLSKPNIFIQYNRWDCMDDEENENPTALVQQQHTENARKFLVDELGLLTSEEVDQRCFFVSAREALNRRLRAKGNAAAKSPQPDEAADERYHEFERFEASFEECISRSAIKTRFLHHARGARELGDALCAHLEQVATETTQLFQERVVFVSQQSEHLKSLKAMRTNTRQDWEEKVVEIANLVRDTVLYCMMEEISITLPDIVEEFEADEEFCEEKAEEYKLALSRFLEARFSSRLAERCAEDAVTCFTRTQDQLYEESESSMPKGKSLYDLVPRRKYSPDFYVHCEFLAQTFHQDLRFRCSLGWEVIAHKLLGEEQMHAISGLLPKQFLALPSYSENQNPVNVIVDVLNSPGIVALLSLASVSFSRVGVVRPWTIKVVAAGALVYMITYGLQRAMYTNRAKERKLKHQFTMHAAHELNALARHISSSVAQGIQRELVQQRDDLMGKIDEVARDTNNLIEKTNKELTRLQAMSNTARQLRQRAISLVLGLNSFIRDFIPA